MKIAHTALFILLLSLVACESPRLSFTWKTVSNDFHGVSARVPRSWKKVEGMPGSILNFSAPPTLPGAFRPNFNLIAEENVFSSSGNSNPLDEIKKKVPLQFRLILADYKLIDQRRLQMTQQYEAIEFKGTYNGREGLRTLHTVMIPTQKQIYTLTATYPTRDEDRYQGIYFAIRDSLLLPGS